VGLRFLGIEVDTALNDSVQGDADISTKAATVRTLVVHAREDVEVARTVRRVLAQAVS
jgi:acetate kinase